MKQNILALLVRNDRLGKLVEYLYSNPIEKYSLRIGILCVIAAFPFIPFEDYKIVGGWLCLVAVVLFIVYTLASFLWNVRFIATPTKSYFADLTKRIEAEDKLISELALENPHQLGELLTRLRFERERLISRIGFLIGAIDKLGIIPAVVALYLTYAKTLDDANLSEVPYPLLGFFAGIYVGCFLVKHVIDRIEHMCLAIESAKIQSESIQEMAALTSHSSGLSKATLPPSAEFKR